MPKRSLLHRLYERVKLPFWMQADGRDGVLLLQHLSIEQRRQFLQFRHFDVVGQSGSKYRLTYERSANIGACYRDSDTVVSNHCVVCEVPLSAQLLVQKLYIEKDEARIRRVGKMVSV